MPALCRLIAVVFLQMLPATLVAPAIRPLFAELHGGHEGAMHAFMAINMAGALVAAPLIGLAADRRGLGRWTLAGLCALDAALLASFTVAPGIGALLALRFVEGAAHVGAATLLLARAAGLARASGRGSIMGMAGAALMFAIAAGSGLGGLVVDADPRLPFWIGAAVSLAVASWAAVAGGEAAVDTPRPVRPPLRRLLSRHRAMWPPLLAAFVARFTVGALIVTFALFAHRAHGLSDGRVGALFAMLTFPFALGTYPMGRLCERVGPARVLAAGAAVYATSLLALGHVPAAALAPVMGVAGLASAALFAPILSYAALLGSGEHRATAMSLVNAAGCLGMLLGPAAAGILSHLAGGGDPVTGYRVVFGMASGAVILWLAAAAPWLRIRARRESDAFAGRAALSP